MPFVRTPRRLKVAVIGCGPASQEPMTYMGTRWTVRGLVSRKIQALASERGQIIEPHIYWPAGYSWDYPTPGTYDAVIIPGSKLNIDTAGLRENPWMHGLMHFIRSIDPGIPTLGICFGHQAIAYAHGGEVTHIPSPLNAEIGFSPIFPTEDARADVIFDTMPERFDGLFSHFTYVSRPPENGTVLAGGILPDMVQAFRVGESKWGVQFHPDYSPANITELVDSRRDQLAEMLDISKIRTINPQRKDHKVLEKFLEHSFEC
jgi:GMP synthase-like glutamine amidotransferase